MYKPLFLALGILFLTSCKQAEGDSIISSEETVEAPSIPTPEYDSFTFNESFMNDVSFTKDLEGKAITVKNLIVSSYSIKDDGTIELMAHCYNPTTNEIVTSDKDNDDVYLNAKQLKKAVFESGEFTYFTIILNDRGELAKLALFDKAESDVSISMFNDGSSYVLKDLVTVTGLYTAPEKYGTQSILSDAVITVQ
jgi:hypothetical protein